MIPSPPARRWKPYPAYKPSGVEWLGEIPAHWKASRLRHACSVNPPRAEIAHLPPSTEVSFLPMEAIGDDGQLDLGQVRILETVWQGYSYFRDGDVIVAKITPCFENGKGALCQNLLGGVGFGTTELHVLRPGVAVTSSFLCYLTRSYPFRNLGIASMQGAAGQQRVTHEFVKDFRGACPPVSEQLIIAAFLDRETAKIDALVAKKERLIELLQEKRAALITHAVTKGLDPAAPMKDPGVGWLGRIPTHWKVRRMKWVARMESGHTPDKKVDAYWADGDIPWVSLNDTAYLKDHDYISQTAYYTNPVGIAHSSARLLPPGSVVFSRDATVGLCAITSRPMAVSQHFIAWVCGDEIRPEYLLQVCRAMGQELDRLTMGATIKTIGMPDVKTLITPVPPRPEQEAIVRHVADETSKIDGLLARVRAHIEKLVEYRAALISAAVTGKIDVRDEAA